MDLAQEAATLILNSGKLDMPPRGAKNRCLLVLAAQRLQDAAADLENSHPNTFFHALAERELESARRSFVEVYKAVNGSGS